MKPVGDGGETVEFAVDADLIRGTMYLPPGGTGPFPVVVLAHGWSMVSGGDLEDYARVIVDRGCAALTFDFRNLGRSDGLPRQEIDPCRQIEDYRGAISYVRQRRDIDGSRIGVWGSSYSGGHAIVVGAVDPRVRCVVAQVPTISGYQAGLRRGSYERHAELQAKFVADREARFAGQEPQTIRTISADQTDSVAYPQADSYEYMTAESRRCPTWRNEVTLRSLELARQYEPGSYVRRIGTKPMLMIVADCDGLTPTDLQLDAYNEAYAPKDLVLVSGGHYSVYTEHFERTSAAAADWFNAHLVTD